MPASLHSSPDLSDQEAKERLTLIQTIQIEIPQIIDFLPTTRSQMSD